MGGADSVRRRQLRAGLAADVDRFRAEQVLWGALGAVVGAGVGVLALVAAGCRRGRRRDAHRDRAGAGGDRRRLPAVPSGGPPRGADADRVPHRRRAARPGGRRRRGSGRRARPGLPPLARRARRSSCDAAWPTPAPEPTCPPRSQGLADRTGLPSLRRFVDGVVIAVQRGTPLADVLRAQAQDVREEGRRALMEAGGRKEIAMMVPVVFLILPVTVLFAVFPGFHLLPFHPLTRKDRPMSIIHTLSARLQLVAAAPPGARSRDVLSAVTCPAGCSSR